MVRAYLTLLLEQQLMVLLIMVYLGWVKKRLRWEDITGQKHYAIKSYKKSYRLRSGQIKSNDSECWFSSSQPIINQNTTKEKLQNKQKRFGWRCYRYPQADW